MNNDRLIEGLRLLQQDPLIGSIAAKLSTGIQLGTNLLEINDGLYFSVRYVPYCSSVSLSVPIVAALCSYLGIVPNRFGYGLLAIAIALIHICYSVTNVHATPPVALIQ